MSELKEKILAIMEKNSKVSVADLAVLLGDTEDIQSYLRDGTGQDYLWISHPDQLE